MSLSDDLSGVAFQRISEVKIISLSSKTLFSFVTDGAKAKVCKRCSGAFPEEGQPTVVVFSSLHTHGGKKEITFENFLDGATKR